jgi:uncharacterized protein (TIGR02145 family)
LYKDGEAVDEWTGTGTAETFTGTFSGAGIYTAQVEAEGKFCAAVMNGSHTVIEHLVPTITPSGGDASQTVNQDSAITPILFTAANGATAVSRSGDLPAGIDGSTEGLVHTISGTPSAAGVFPYTITATGDGDCVVTTSGTITVRANTPTFAASTRTWVITGNGITQTWSDKINVPDCLSSTFTNDNTNPKCSSATLNGVLFYYYNWPYVNVYQNQLCPPAGDWRVPTKQDFINLDILFGGTGANRTATTAYVNNNYYDTWGGELSGLLQPHLNNTDHLSYWTSSPSSASAAYHLELRSGTYLQPQDIDANSTGMPVRCVK